MSVTAVHLRSKVKTEEARKLLGKHIGTDAYDLLLTGNANVYKPNGDLLLALRKQVVPEVAWRGAEEALTFLKRYTSENRGGYAGGIQHKRVKADGTKSKTTITFDAETGEKLKVPSSIVGYFDRYPRTPFCRETAFVANEVNRWKTCLPLVAAVGEAMKEAVPARWKVQNDVALRTSPDFVVKGTPFTTLTVNNSVRAACHYDKGDLKEGFGCISVIRQGAFRGFHLVFPEFRVAADIDNGDVLFFDSHEMHANTAMEPIDEGARRISVVYYYRSKMLECGTVKQELERAKRQPRFLLGDVDEAGAVIS